MRNKKRFLTTKKVAAASVSIILILGLGLGLNLYQTRQNNVEIDDLVLTYYQAVNNREYSALGDSLTPTYPDSNEFYLQDIKTKSDAVGMESVRAEKIYPALVTGKFGLVGVISKTQNNYDGQETSFEEFNLLLVRNVNGKWYIATPQDAKELGIARLTKLFNNYQASLKDDEMVKQVLLSQKEAFSKRKLNQTSSQELASNQAEEAIGNGK